MVTDIRQQRSGLGANAKSEVGRHRQGRLRRVPWGAPGGVCLPCEGTTAMGRVSVSSENVSLYVQ